MSHEWRNRNEGSLIVHLFVRQIQGKQLPCVGSVLPGGLHIVKVKMKWSGECLIFWFCATRFT